MYNSPTQFVGTSFAAGGGALMLPQTGLDTVWFVLGAFALLAAGFAVLRTVPRREA